jgi:hypothetical protein
MIIYQKEEATKVNNNLAPRFNFNYKLDNSSGLRGGYGISYDKVNYALYSDACSKIPLLKAIN